MNRSNRNPLLDNSRNPLLGSHSFDGRRSSSNYSSNNGANYQSSSSHEHSPFEPIRMPIIRPKNLNSAGRSEPFGSRSSSSRRPDSRSQSPSYGRSSKRRNDRRSNSPSYRRKRSKNSKSRRTPFDDRRRHRLRSPDSNRRSKSSDREIKNRFPVNKKSVTIDKSPKVEAKMYEEQSNLSLDYDRIKTPPWYDSSPKNFEDDDKHDTSTDDIVSTVTENSSSTKIANSVNLNLQMPLDVSDLDFLKDDDVEFTIVEELISDINELSPVEETNGENTIASANDEKSILNLETSNVEKSDEILTDPTLKTFDEISKLVENCEFISDLTSIKLVGAPENHLELPENLFAMTETEVVTTESTVATTEASVAAIESTAQTMEPSVATTETIVATSENSIATAENDYSTLKDVEKIDIDLKPVFKLLDQSLNDIQTNDDELILRADNVVQSWKKIKIEQKLRPELTKFEKKLSKMKKYKEFFINQPSVVLEPISEKLLIKYGCRSASTSVVNNNKSNIFVKQFEHRPSTIHDDVYAVSLNKLAVSPNVVEEKKNIDVGSKKKVVDDIEKKQKVDVDTIVKKPKATSVAVENKLFWKKLEVQENDVVKKPKQSIIKPAETSKVVENVDEKVAVKTNKITGKVQIHVEKNQKIIENSTKTIENSSKTVEKSTKIAENQQEKNVCCPKINLAAKMKQANEEKVSKEFWETPRVGKNSVTDVAQTTMTVEEPSSTESESIPGLGMSSPPPPPATVIATTLTSTVAANYLNKFKIKKIDPKQRQMKTLSTTTAKNVTCDKSSADYVSPLDKIMDETKKFTASSSQFKRRQERVENKTNAKIQRQETDKRQNIEETRRNFEKRIARRDEVANFAKELVNVLKQSTSSSMLLTPNVNNNSYSSMTPMSPCGSVSSGGGRSSIMASSDFGSGFDSKRLRSDQSSSSGNLLSNVDSSSSSSYQGKIRNNSAYRNYSRKTTPPSTPSLPSLFDSVKTITRNAPTFGEGPSEFIWDGTKDFNSELEPSTTMSSADIAAKTKFLLESFALSQQRKALLKPPLLTTAPQQTAMNVGQVSPVPTARDPLLPLPRGPKTPPPSLLPLPTPSNQVENRHRVLITDTPDLMSFLTRGSPAPASTSKKPSLLGTPDLLSSLSSNQKKPSLLRTPLLSTLPQTSSVRGIGDRSTKNVVFSNFDTQKLPSMINPELLVSITKAATKPSSSTSYCNNKGNLTMNDAQAYLLASTSNFDEILEENESFDEDRQSSTVKSFPRFNSAVAPEPVRTSSSTTTELLNMVDDIAQDESAMQAVLLEIFRGLSQNSSTDVVSGEATFDDQRRPTDVQSNTDVTQLKGILFSLLNDPRSILQTDHDRRQKAESLLKVLDEMELLDSKNPVFEQCNLLDPVRNFTEEVIELSESLSNP